MRLPDPEALIERLAQALAPRLTAKTAFVGIHTGGAWVAERLHRHLSPKLPLGLLDITFYRDDFSRIGLHPVVAPSAIPFEVEGANIVLVDDVLHTGRTVRAAMNELFDYGRPARIELAVLIDRGGRELPIQPDVAGTTLELRDDQNVQLTLAGDGTLRLTLHQRTTR